MNTGGWPPSSPFGANAYGSRNASSEPAYCRFMSRTIDVEKPEPASSAASFSRRSAGRGGSSGVHDRVDEYERRGQRPRAVAQSLGDAGDEVAARAGAAEVQVVGRRAQLVGVGRRPQPPVEDVVGRHGVVHPAQRLVVVEREHREPARGDGERDPVCFRKVKIAADERPAVHPDERGASRGPGAVESDRGHRRAFRRW